MAGFEHASPARKMARLAHTSPFAWLPLHGSPSRERHSSGFAQPCQGVVDPNWAGAAPCQPGRHMRGAAAKLDHVQSGNVVRKHAHLGLGHAPDPPRRLVACPGAPTRLPLRAIAPDVLGKLAHALRSLSADWSVLTEACVRLRAPRKHERGELPALKAGRDVAGDGVAEPAADGVG